MKKILYCILTVLIGLFCFGACGEEEKAQDTGKQPEKPKQEITIEFVENEVSLSIGESKQMEVITSKNNVFIFWSVRDKEIASVSDKGVITALAEGQTICYASFGNSVAICLITVSADETTPMLSLSVAHEELSLYESDTFDLHTVVKLGDEIVQGAEIEFSVDNEEIVSVVDGAVSALSEGNATITITATYEEYETSLRVSVTVYAALNS